MDFGLMHSIATVAAMTAFFAIGWWAYSPKNEKRFEEAAQLVLDEEQPNDEARQQPKQHAEEETTDTGDTHS